MYAVIRSGGKQYRVSPGEMVRVEKLDQESGQVEWTDVLAVQDEAGKLKEASAVRVTGTIVAQRKAAKILVFHYKRKKQYKKLRGHRQQYTMVRVDAIQA